MRVRENVLATTTSVAIMLVGLLLASRPAQAVPAFARQFASKCSTCHTPVPPRLNNIGIAFRRMGYRMPEADDEGKLILKEKPSQSVFNDASVIADFRTFDTRSAPPQFELHEFEAFAGGSIGKYVSYTAEVEWEGEWELDMAEVQALLGRPEANFTVRGGLIGPLVWEKGNHQRLGIARPLLYNNRVRAGVFRGFRLRDGQQGVDLGLNLNKLAAEGGTMRNTFLSLGIFNGITQEDGEITDSETNSAKDIMVQLTQLWGENHTVGVLYYRGKAELGDELEDEFDRLAVFGNYRLKTGTDFLAGVGRGSDQIQLSGLDIDSRGWFFEIEQAIKSQTVALVRYDRFEPDRANSTRDIDGYTVGLTHQPHDNVLLRVEYQSLQTGSAPRTKDFTFSVMFLY